MIKIYTGETSEIAKSILLNEINMYYASGEDENIFNFPCVLCVKKEDGNEDITYYCKTSSDLKEIQRNKVKKIDYEVKNVHHLSEIPYNQTSLEVTFDISITTIYENDDKEITNFTNQISTINNIPKNDTVEKITLSKLSFEWSQNPKFTGETSTIIQNPNPYKEVRHVFVLDPSNVVKDVEYNKGYEVFNFKTWKVTYLVNGDEKSEVVTNSTEITLFKEFEVTGLINNTDKDIIREDRISPRGYANSFSYKLTIKPNPKSVVNATYKIENLSYSNIIGWDVSSTTISYDEVTYYEYLDGSTGSSINHINRRETFNQNTNYYDETLEYTIVFENIEEYIEIIHRGHKYNVVLTGPSYKKELFITGGTLNRSDLPADAMEKTTAISFANTGVTEAQITTLGDSVFADFKKLHIVILPECFTIIGDNAFSGCTELNSVMIPSGIVKIGNGTFKGCTNLITVTGVIAMGKGIVTIGDNAFEGCVNLTGVPTLNYLKNLGNRAFSGCRSLASSSLFTYANALTKISSEAFKGCAFSVITLSSSITTIEEGAFSDCANLISVSFGDNLLSIDSKAFNGCTKLNQINITTPIAPSITNNTFLNVKENGVLTYPEGSDYDSWLSLEESYLGYYNWNDVKEETSNIVVTYLDDIKKYRQETNLTSTVIELIGNASNIKKIELSKNVTSIGDSTCVNCENLEEISFKNNESGLETIGNYAFSGCTKLSKFNSENENECVLPNSMSSIGIQAFFDTPITTVIFKSAQLVENDYSPYVESSLNGVFSGESKDMTSIVWDITDNSITEIGGSFCVNFAGTLNCSPEKIESIKTNAFCDAKLQNPNVLTLLAQNATRIEDYAFYRSNLSGTLALNQDGELSIGKASFAKTGIVTLDNTSSLSQIPTSAFCECSSLTRVNLDVNGDNNTLKEIDNYAFSKCSNLQIVVLPSWDNEQGYESLDQSNCFYRIGASAFYECSNLELVEFVGSSETEFDSNIPSSVKVIEQDAFYGCSKLKSLKIGYGSKSKLEKIYPGAFYNIGIKSGATYDYLGTVSDYENVWYDMTAYKGVFSHTTLNVYCLLDETTIKDKWGLTN